MSQQQVPDRKLIFGSNKFLITKRLYQELIAQTNLIKSYDDCKNYVWKTLRQCSSEVKEVRELTGKIDFEI